MRETQVELAVAGVVTPEMESVARAEGLDAGLIRARVAEGQIVLPTSRNRKANPVGIGMGLRTKVNASIGTSTDIVDLDAEIRKAQAAESAGADTLMELSVGGDLDRIRREILAAVHLPVGNVPLYQAFCEAIAKFGDPTSSMRRCFSRLSNGNAPMASVSWPSTAALPNTRSNG
jgi:phosphomethylpyrimidine synthase